MNDFLVSRPVHLDVAIGARAMGQANMKGSMISSISCLPLGECIPDNDDTYDEATMQLEMVNRRAPSHLSKMWRRSPLVRQFGTVKYEHFWLTMVAGLRFTIHLQILSSLRVIARLTTRLKPWL